MTQFNTVEPHHQHGDNQLVMKLVHVSKVDGLSVRRYDCSCGHSVVLLERIEGEAQGSSWPFNWNDA